MLFNRPDATKGALPVGSSTPHAIHVPWTHLTQRPKLHLDRFSRFYTAHDRVRILYNMHSAKERVKQPHCHYYFRFNGSFPGKPGLASLHLPSTSQFPPFCSRRELGLSGTANKGNKQV